MLLKSCVWWIWSPSRSLSMMKSMRILWRMSRRSVTSLVSFKTRVLCGKAFVTLPIVIIESHYSCNVSRFIDGHQAFLQEIDLTWLIILPLGTVKSLEIPRPRAGQDVTGVGKIFVEFTDTDGCNKGRFLIFITYYCVIVVFLKNLWKLWMLFRVESLLRASCSPRFTIPKCITTVFSSRKIVISCHSSF